MPEQITITLPLPDDVEYVHTQARRRYGGLYYPKCVAKYRGVSVEGWGVLTSRPAEVERIAYEALLNRIRSLA